MQTTILASPANTVTLSRVGSVKSLPDGPAAANEAAKNARPPQDTTKLIGSFAAIALITSIIYNLSKRGSR